MSRFFFDLDGHEPDDTGEELANAFEARGAAIALLGRILSDDPTYALQGHWRVDVTDESRRTLYSVSVVVEGGEGSDALDQSHD